MKSKIRFFAIALQGCFLCCVFADERKVLDDRFVDSFERQLADAIIRNDARFVETNLSMLSNEPFLFSDHITDSILGIRTPLSLACYLGKADICQMILNNSDIVVYSNSCSSGAGPAPIDFALEAYSQGKKDMEPIVLQLALLEQQSSSIIDLCQNVIKSLLRRNVDDTMFMTNVASESIVVIDESPKRRSIPDCHAYVMAISTRREVLSDPVIMDAPLTSFTFGSGTFVSFETIVDLANTIDAYFSYPSFALVDDSQNGVTNKQIQLAPLSITVKGLSQPTLLISIHTAGDSLMNSSQLGPLKPCSCCFALINVVDHSFVLQPLFAAPFVVIHSVPVFLL